MTLLAKLGAAYGTDKGDSNHTFKGQSYLDVYEEYFHRLRLQKMRVLEMGVLKGCSLRMWSEYFPESEIWGLDIDPEAKVCEGGRIHMVTGSQDDVIAMSQVAHGNPLDIVIDDASHVVDHMVASLRMLWPRITPGGYYVIEDTGCTHRDISDGRDGWPGQYLNPAYTNYANDRGKFRDALEAKIKDMDLLTGNCRHVHFWPMMVVLRKTA